MRLLEVSDAFSFHSSLYFRMGVLSRISPDQVLGQASRTTNKRVSPSTVSQ